MSIVGIVAEYNPLHHGHQYHIRKSRADANGGAIVAVISADFVQRGEPALLDKGDRARMALAAGVDLVLELPVVFSCHNAGLFANAAVDILAATGVVDAISFGMENPEADLERLADLLNAEPEDFRAALKKRLAEGYSFVQARGMALDELLPGSLEILRGANNNLALAYVKRVRERGYPLVISPVGRVGMGFHDRGGEAGGFASATAVRHVFGTEGIEEASALLPGESAAILRRAAAEGRVAADADRLWRAFKGTIVRCGAEGLRQVAEMREGLENRLLDAARRSGSLVAFVDACTSRRYPKGRIQRYCAHALIGLTHEESRCFQERGPAYLRVLGANARGRELLAEMRGRASLPVISRASAPPDAYARRMMDVEHRATELWELLTERPLLRAEARRVPVLIA